MGSALFGDHQASYSQIDHWKEMSALKMWEAVTWPVLLHLEIFFKTSIISFTILINFTNPLKLDRSSQNMLITGCPAIKTPIKKNCNPWEILAAVVQFLFSTTSGE